MDDFGYIKARYYFDVKPLPVPSMIMQMTSKIDDIEPVRRRGYLRLMWASRKYQRLSLQNKVRLRRRLLKAEVCAI